MEIKTIVMCVVALILGMLLANMLKSVCGCKNIIEGQHNLAKENLTSQKSTVLRDLEEHFPHKEVGGMEPHRRMYGHPQPTGQANITLGEELVNDVVDRFNSPFSGKSGN